MRNISAIMKGFPAVPYLPPKPYTKEGVEAHAWQFYAYRAVHGQDPVHREVLLDSVIDYLLADEPLAEPAQEWLVFVLMKMLYRVRDGEDAIPHLAPTQKGRPIDYNKRSRLSNSLFGFLSLNDQWDRRRLPIKEALRHFARKHRKAYSTIRKFYYSKEFKGHREVLLAFRSAKK